MSISIVDVTRIGSLRPSQLRAPLTAAPHRDTKPALSRLYFARGHRIIIRQHIGSHRRRLLRPGLLGGFQQLVQHVSHWRHFRLLKDFVVQGKR